MATAPLSVIVLAAGAGKRMRSQLPKVLHPVAAKPMLSHVLEAAYELNPSDIIVVYGHGGEQVKAALSDAPVHWVYQAQTLGTGHAVAQAMPSVPAHHQVLILCADVPLIQPKTLQALVTTAGADGVALLTVNQADPTGYGRIVRDGEGSVQSIVEEKDASVEQRLLTEVNTGIMCWPAQPLTGWLDALNTTNAQGEYYLTDCIAQAQAAGYAVNPLACPNAWEVQGVNDRAQLAFVERAFQRQQAERLMREAGLGLADPARFDLRGSLTHGRDCYIDANVILEGDVVLGDNVRIGPFTSIRDSHIESGTEVLGHCDIESSRIGADCRIGPFARLRMGTALDQSVRIGNFVETKNAQVQEGSKINHLSYIGDADLGVGVNVGAGTITCNYDGVNKHRTHIGDRVFIGSNTALVAPIRLGSDVTVGAGTTLRDDVPGDTLAVNPAQPQQIHGWRRRTAKASKSQGDE